MLQYLFVLVCVALIYVTLVYFETRFNVEGVFGMVMDCASCAGSDYDNGGICHHSLSTSTIRS